MKTLRQFATGQAAIPPGTAWYLSDLRKFSVAQLKMGCPGSSRDMVRPVLRERQAAGEIECQGRGPAAERRKKG